MVSRYSVPKPTDHITELRTTSRPIPPSPSYGIDSPLGLLLSNILSPLYLYASLKGKFDAWDAALAELPPEALDAPSLDMGCGRGLVLLKLAQLKKKKKKHAATAVTANYTVDPVYGVDLFITGDQSGNVPEATYDNVAALDVLDEVVLHTASFTELPFCDAVMGLVTASLSVHNVDREARRLAIVEAARVLRSGGYLAILELYGYVGEYAEVLRGLGWEDVRVELGGLAVMYGAWPCQWLKGRKP